MRKLSLKNGRHGKVIVAAAMQGQADLLAEWRESGLITDAQFTTFTRTSQPAAKGRR